MIDQSELKRQAEILAIAHFGSNHARWWGKCNRAFYGLTPSFMFRLFPDVVYKYLLERKNNESIV